MDYPWFDEQFYLRSKLAHLIDNDFTEYTTAAQVREAIESTGMTIFEHFQKYSLQEKTSPSQYFNTYEYLQAKADQLNADSDNGETWTVETVAEAFAEVGYSTAWDHYNAHGLDELLNPSNEFDTQAYLDAKLQQLQNEDPDGNWTMPEVIAAFKQAGLNPVSHYAEYGREEGLPTPPVPIADQVTSDPLSDVDYPGPAWFDEQYYLETKLAKLQADGLNEYVSTEQVRDAIETAGYTLYGHFQEHSLVEQTSPSPYFNTNEYLQAKVEQLNSAPDSTGDWNVEKVIEAFQAAGYATAWDHFTDAGMREKINPSNGFDLAAYLNDKVEALQLADPTGNWDADAVIESMQALGLNAVSHYEAYGKSEGLAPTPVAEENRVDPDPLREALFSVTNEDGSVSFTHGSGNISYTLDGTVATFARGGIVDPVNTVDLADGDITLNLAAGQTLAANPVDLGGVTVTGEGNLALTNTATVAELTAIDFSGVGSVTYSIEDTTEALFAAPAGLVSGATSVTANMSDEGDTYTAASSAEASNKLTLNGGAGNDTLVATLDQPIASPQHAPRLSSVENLSLTATAAGAGILLTNATGVEAITNNGSTEGLSVINVGDAVTLAAVNVNSDQTDPFDPASWDASSNFVVRYRDAEAAPEAQEITLSNSNLNLLTVTALGRDEDNNIVPATADIKELSINSTGEGANTIRTFNEGNPATADAGLQASVETITITGDQDLTIIDLPTSTTTVDASTATGNLYLVFNGENDISITGGAGNDVIFGGNGKDVLTGGVGDDVLYGRGGADTMSGGAGNDTFVIQTDEVAADAADIVLDFEVAGDQLNFNVGATASTVFTKATAAAADFDAALAAAISNFTADGQVGVNAQQVGDDLWVFADADGNGQADAVVQLVGIALDEFTEANVFSAV